jgi:tRNA (mo5U34)-methyltransferase
MDSDVAGRADALGWYHTLELAPGVVTKGMFDLRPHVERYGLPAGMAGLRALDIGTWDGFWAFEMERRGAAVVALDLDTEAEQDWPPRRRPPEPAGQPRGEGFRLAREALGSHVERVSRSVYDARPEELGHFDVIMCGSVLVHLRDQLLALERLAGLCAPGGLLVCAEPYDRLAGLVPFPVVRYRADLEASVVFWMPSVRTWRRMLWTAGFEAVRRHARLRLRSRAGFSVPHVVLHARGAA